MGAAAGDRPGQQRVAAADDPSPVGSPAHMASIYATTETSPLGLIASLVCDCRNFNA
jgi:hypothetical protein